MLYDYNTRYWVPKTALKEKRELIDKEMLRIVNGTPDPDNPGYTFGGDKIETVKPPTVEREMVQPENQNTGAPVAAKEEDSKETKKTTRPKLKRPFKSLDEVMAPTENIPVCKPEPVLSQDKIEPITETHFEAVEQSKKTRRSAKMVEADFDSLAARFITPTALKDKKPLFFPEEIREALRKIAGLVPGGKVSPSHIAVHVIEAWIDENRELLNRMFANQKTSI